jgi:hypothetical protein
MVDRALQRELLWETPPVFEGRWKDISDRLGIGLEPDRLSRRRSEVGTGLLTVALTALALLVGAAWSADHTPPEPIPALAIVPGVTVTAATAEGEEVSVNIETADSDDGTVYLWLDAQVEDDSDFEPEQR